MFSATIQKRLNKRLLAKHQQKAMHCMIWWWGYLGRINNHFSYLGRLCLQILLFLSSCCILHFVNFFFAQLIIQQILLSANYCGSIGQDCCRCCQCFNSCLFNHRWAALRLKFWFLWKFERNLFTTLVLGRRVQFGFLNLETFVFSGRTVNLFGQEKCECIACDQMMEGALVRGC